MDEFIDSDGDGWDDSSELALGTDPYDLYYAPKESYANERGYFRGVVTKTPDMEVIDRTENVTTRPQESRAAEEEARRRAEKKRRQQAKMRKVASDVQNRGAFGAALRNPLTTIKSIFSRDGIEEAGEMIVGVPETIGIAIGTGAGSLAGGVIEGVSDVVDEVPALGNTFRAVRNYVIIGGLAYLGFYALRRR